MAGYIALLLLFVAGVYIVALYNQLVLVKHNVARAWANIDVLLKQRHDEIPKLVELCRQYSRFESTLLARLTAARTAAVGARDRASATAVGAAEDALRAETARVIAVAEGYPDLKANTQFLALQARIAALETAIADRREFYNETVRINNVTIGQFPQRLLAGWFAFRAAEPLKFRHG
ncbi:MAG: LemA family protein [Steroidobacteraceae bacterium]|nr:LemA family protein [Steroidobacteraceae bacterium]MCW5571467.1 LemA family protein [Steroidobacteraceae bacterium]